MTILAEDPTYLVVALGLLAGAFLMALKVRQQAKYLFWALGMLALILAVVVIEQVWVTDNERIERVIYNLRRAVLASDSEGVLAHLAPDVEYVQHGTSISGEATRTLIRTNLANAAFDFVHINDLQTNAGRQTRRGTAEFRIYAKGTLHTSLATYNVGTANSIWSLGFQETAPGVWKVNRITPVSVPEGAITVPSLASSTADRGNSPIRRRVPGLGPFGPESRDGVSNPRIRGRGRAASPPPGSESSTEPPGRPSD
jgi:ketosteroid isomerase-like protein